MVTSTFSMAHLFTLLSLSLCFLASVLAGPIPSDAIEERGPTDLSKRINHSGVGTYFLQNGNAGACGWVSSESSFIVATSKIFWEKNGSSNCKQYVHITGRGKSAYAMVADECPECEEGHLDMSQGLFKHFAPESVGEFDIEWHFMAKGWKP